MYFFSFTAMIWAHNWRGRLISVIIEDDYPPDANFPPDNPCQADNPSLV